MDRDPTASQQPVEHGARLGAGAHGQAELGVGRVGEPADAVQGQAGARIGPSSHEVEHAAAPDGGQLVPVTDQRDPSAGLVGDGEQGPGGVLVQHPGRYPRRTPLPP